MNDLFFSDLSLIKKDKKQFEAFNSMGNTALIAGPGSGKTRVLSLKAVALAKNSIHKPCGLACISYSRESVRELKKRLRSYGYQISNRDFIGTVHSFSLLHIIQPFAHLYPQYKIPLPIKILPKDVGTGIYNSVLSELGIDDPRNLQFVDINKCRSLSIKGKSGVSINSTEQITRAAVLYSKKLRQTEFIDFIDIINISAKIIREQEFVRKCLQSKFPWLLIDEYQDLGKALHEMVLELVFNAEIKLYAVGDVNQSIYGFNGGYPDFLTELTGHDDIKPVYLDANYRSSQHIIDASLETLQPAPPLPRYTAEKRKEDTADFTFITCEEEMTDQYKVVCEKVIPSLIEKGIPLNEIGIITGSNPEIQHLSDFLKNKDIPFFIVNWKFENSAVVVWLQECALWCSDSARQIFNELVHFWNRLLEAHNDPRKNWESIRVKTDLYEILESSKRCENIFKWICFVVGELNLVNTLKDSELYPNEIENIDNLKNECEFHNLKGASVARFANLGFPDNEVTVTTRHSSKGLEFEAVILLGMEEEHFPNFYAMKSDIALAEAQRLCYVCISRAKKACILIRSKVFTLNTRRGPWRKDYAPSRYWTGLHKKFGTPSNSFDAASF